MGGGTEYGTVGMTLDTLLSLLRQSLVAPREGAASVMSLGLSRDAVWTAAILVVILSIILAQGTAMLMGISGGTPMGPVVFSPFAAVAIYVFFVVGTAAAVHGIGRMMGGTGQFPEALLLITWLQFIMVCLQVVQVFTMFLMPPLSAVIAMLGLALFIWLLINFIAELHGFRSLAQVFVMVLVSAFGLAFLLSMALALLGVSVPIQSGGAL